MASKAEQPQLDDAVKAAREKLKARFGDKVRIGGKGKPAPPPSPAPRSFKQAPRGGRTRSCTRRPPPMTPR